MNKPEDLDALLDIYLFSEINDEDALDDYLKANKIEFEKFSKAVEELITHKKAELEFGEEGMVISH